MQKIKIDDKEYDVASLSDAAKQQLQMLQFVEAELTRLAAQNAAMQTARRAYQGALRTAIEGTPNPMASETIKFS